MSKNTKTRIEGLVELGVSPAKLKTSDAIALIHGKTRIVLVDIAGDPTAAGKYWSTHTKRELPQGIFMPQVAIREGNTETIQLKDGKKVTRRWTTDGEFSFTKLGDQYYAKQKRNSVVQVPVVVKGTRRDGTKYTTHSHIPVERLGITKQLLPMSLSAGERDIKIKEMIEQQLPSRALYEVSKEEWVLDASGSWIVNEETVQFDEATGETESNVVLDRRVGAGPTMTSQFLFPEALCPEAFEARGDYLCSPRQIAAVLKRDLDQVVADLIAIELMIYNTEDLHTRGCTPRVIIEYAKKHELACVLMHNEKTVERIPGNRPLLAFALHEDHCYFFLMPSHPQRSYEAMYHRHCKAKEGTAH